MDCKTHASLFCKLGRTKRVITILLEKTFQEKKVSLNLPQFIILNILNSHQHLILEDLSKHLHKDKSAVMRHINHLESKHFVAKMLDPKDKRRKVLLLTQTGIDILKLARSIESQLQQKITQNINNDDLILINSVLGQMQNQADLILNKSH